MSTGILYAVGFDRLKPMPETDGPMIKYIDVPDWNRDLSPWEWKNAPKRMGTFQGGADDFLKRIGIQKGGIIGYSLAGLFSLYAALETGCIEYAGCLSGSLWYPGFTEYLEKKEIPTAIKRVYISLGDGESRTSNAIFSKNEEFARKTAEILNAKGVVTELEILPGGHSSGAEDRIGRGFERMKEYCKICL